MQRTPMMYFINKASIAIPAYEGETSPENEKVISYWAYEQVVDELKKAQEKAWKYDQLSE